MFPITNEDTQTLTSGNKTFAFKDGDFYFVDGKIITFEDENGVKIKIDKFLHTIKGRYAIYDDYGTYLQTVLFSDYDYDFIKSEIKRQIEDAVSTLSEVRSISNFSFIRDYKTLFVSFETDTIYGNIETEVIF